MSTNSFLRNIETALQKLANSHTEDTLGDRSTYLGASEVGSCPRKTVLTKLSPPTHDLTSLLHFKRGHMAEDILAEAFLKSGYNFERQAEVQCDMDGVPVNLHIDFVFTSETQKVKKILEVKSPGSMPEFPYASWDMQTHFQMGMLAQKHPGYKVSAGILGFQFGKDGLQLWNGYDPNMQMFSGLKERAKRIWSFYEKAKTGEIDTETIDMDVSPLCAYCHAISTCPKFQAFELPELDEYVAEYIELKGKEKKVKAEIDSRKEYFLKILEERGSNFKAGGKILRRTECSRSSTDMQALNEFLKAIAVEPDRFNRSTSYVKFDMVKAA